MIGIRHIAAYPFFYIKKRAATEVTVQLDSVV